jgi:hypothetical protein
MKITPQCIVANEYFPETNTHLAALQTGDRKSGLKLFSGFDLDAMQIQFTH